MNQPKWQLPTSRISGLHRHWALICFILSGVAAALIFSLAYNAQTGYITGTPVNALLTALVICELAISALLVRSAPIYINEGNRTAISRVATLILHITIIFCGVMATSGCNDAYFSIDAIKKIDSSGFLPSDILKGGLFISSVAVFLSSPSLRKKDVKYGIMSQTNGYATIFFCIIGIAILYFNMSVEMNNPQKLYLQFALAAICLSTLYTMKDKIQGKNSRLSLFFKLSSISIAPIASISTFIAFVKDGKHFPTAYFYFAIAVCVYAIAQVIDITFSQKQE